MENAQLDSALSRLRGFAPRKATPIALKVKIDNQDKSFLIDPATGKVRTPPPSYGWAKDFDFKELKRFFLGKGYKVEEVMGDVAPVLV
jgi:hypothetical protein